MSLSVSKSALKPKLLAFLRNVEKGKRSIVVTDRGKPVAKIIPYKSDVADLVQSLKGSVLSYKHPLAPIADTDWKL